MISFKSFFLLFCILNLVTGCNKTSTITVHVQQQSAGQPVKVSAGVSVLLLNTANRNDFKGNTSSSAGVVIFTDVNAGSYKVTAQTWDGSKGLADSAFFQVRNGNSVEANLLLR